ncbi:MAG TPA: hypothetical protein VGT01_02255 [Candidatus Dormibacteraeota bacterium]|nr:hypothetical protein [Candidatus Dormibacteraeota bacterium]
MRNLIRSPLTWLVAAEIVVVAAIVAVAWTVAASAGHRSAPQSIAGVPQATDDPGSSLPDLPQLNNSSARGPLPGLAVDPSFWRQRLGNLNDDQVYLEQLEWQIVRSGEAAVNRYLETVVLPAIHRAEHAGGVAVA